jgi:hypothetical protein
MILSFHDPDKISLLICYSLNKAGITRDLDKTKTGQFWEHRNLNRASFSFTP